MSPDERAKLVAGWIEHCTEEVVRDDQNVFTNRKGKENLWAFEQLYDLCNDEPQLCWELILQILETPHPDSVHAALAAGPLEDLIAKHGDQFIRLIEEQAKANPKFRHLLGGVWQNVTHKDIWARVEAARDHTW